MRDVNGNVPAWVGITYLIYCSINTIVVLGGCGYAVFVLGHNGWWFALAAVAMGSTFRPWQWNGLFTGKVVEFSRPSPSEDRTSF